jgi:hypothetical protein
MSENDDLVKEMEKLINSIREKKITLSKQGKQRLIRKFPTLKDEIQKIPENSDLSKNNSTSK